MKAHVWVMPKLHRSRSPGANDPARALLAGIFQSPGRPPGQILRPRARRPKPRRRQNPGRTHRQRRPDQPRHRRIPLRNRRITRSKIHGLCSGGLQPPSVVGAGPSSYKHPPRQASNNRSMNLRLTHTRQHRRSPTVSATFISRRRVYRGCVGALLAAPQLARAPTSPRCRS